MKRQSIYAGIFLLAIVLLATAGTKLSQMRRTTTLKSNDLFMVVRTTDGKRTNFTIETRYLGPELGPYITNSGSGGSGNSIASDSGKGTNTDFYGTVELFGQDFFSGATANVFSNSVTIGGDLSLQGFSDVAATLTALGTNITYSSNELYSQIVAAGISANTATNIARYWATNAALQVSNQLLLTLAAKTNPTLYGTVTIDSATANEVAAFSSGKGLVPVPGVSPTELGFIDGLTENVQDALNAFSSGALTSFASGISNVVYLNSASNVVSTLSNVVSGTRYVLAKGAEWPVRADSVKSNGLGAINIFNKTNVEIVGYGATIYATNIGDVLFLTNCHNFQIEGLTVKGTVETNYAALGPIGVVWGALGFFACNDLRLYHNRIIDHHDHGMLDYASQGGNWKPATTNVQGRFNFFYNGGSMRTNEGIAKDGTAIVPTGGDWTDNTIMYWLRGIEPYIENLSGSATAQNTLLARNRIINSMDDAILTAGSTNAHGLIIEDNIIEWHPGATWRGSNFIVSATGININGGQRVKILRNKIHNAPNYDISIIGDLHKHGYQINDNTGDGHFYASSGGGGIQINTTAALWPNNAFEVNRNYISNKRIYGMALAGIRNSEAVGNTLINTGTNAYTRALWIYTDGSMGVSNVVLRDTTIINDERSAGVPTRGIDIESGAKAMRILNTKINGISTEINNGAGSEVLIRNHTTGSTNQLATIGNLNVASNALASASGGGSGTNNPVLSASPTIAIIANQTARAMFTTNASFAWTITGASNQSTVVEVELANTSTNTIYATNALAPHVVEYGSNVTTLAIAPTSKLITRSWLNRSNEWVMTTFGAPYALTFSGAGVTMTTNHTTKTVDAAISGSGSGSSSFNETNITVSNTNLILLDVGSFDLFRLSLLTNYNWRVTNISNLRKRAQVYFQQDTNGQRLLGSADVAGGLLQTNANLQATTNANGLDVLEILPGFFSSNAIAWWPQNFQPRIAFTNSLDDGVIDCSAAGQSFLTINGVTASAADYYASGFTSDGQDICKVELNLAVNASETASFFVELRSAAATNSPSQTVLATSDTKTAASIGTTTNYVTFSFPSTVSTASGSTNWWVVRKTSSSAFGLNFGRASGSVNLMKSSPDGIAWTDVSTTRQGNYRTFKP